MATATPLLTTSFLNWIEKQDTKNLNFLEFGAGNSSIYFSNLFKYVISYEDNDMVTEDSDKMFYEMEKKKE